MKFFNTVNDIEESIGDLWLEIEKNQNRISTCNPVKKLKFSCRESQNEENEEQEGGRAGKGGKIFKRGNFVLAQKEFEKG
ncbi:MAG: hypothetical protein JRF56_07040 [Deltaproteobacteria bacterium]|jgi:hypothetical protein|nr:hypothetical protein [Deltaproteobacteria bacterium]